MTRIIRCKTCNKVILKVKGHAGKSKIMSAIRHHYLKNHPQKFKRFSKRTKSTKMEMKEHPQLSQEQAKRISKQHEMSETEREYYGGKYYYPDKDYYGGA